MSIVHCQLLVAGVDEAGRGPLAGPVCAAAVILPERYELPGLTDSKKLSEKRREALFPLICEQAVAYHAAQATVAEISEYNIREATRMAMRRAVAGLGVAPDELWIDGNMAIGACREERLIVGGDGLHDCIAAASVLAKVTRDRLMGELDSRYPGYGFAEHKGYGTEAHALALEAMGPCPEHRKLFVDSLLRNRRREREGPAAPAGRMGEDIALKHLQEQGYKLLERNYTVHSGEIDLIVRDGDMIVFVEVKQRRGSNYGSALEAVTRSKQKRMISAARQWMLRNSWSGAVRFDVVAIQTQPLQVFHIPNAITEVREYR